MAECLVCGYLFAHKPEWLSEAYSTPMTSVDQGPLNRCIENSRATKVLIELFHNRRGRYLDFGGGYGLLVRRMRDLGYQYFRHDPQCPNLFANRYDAALTASSRFEMITAFEVLEHLVDPRETIERILSVSQSFLFSTVLLPQPRPAYDAWWYFGPEHGQHVSFYSVKTLDRLARAFGKRLVSNMVDLHLITSRPVTSSVFRFVTSNPFRAAFELLHRRRSLLPSDFEQGREEAFRRLAAEQT